MDRGASMTASSESDRRPNYVSRGSADDIQARINRIRADLGEIAEDVSGYAGDDQRFPLDVSRSIVAMLRDVSNRQTEIHLALSRATDPWTPGVEWESDYIALASGTEVAAAFLTPHIPAVLALDTSQANQLDDALDAAAVNLERYRRLLVARRTELAGNITRTELAEILGLSSEVRYAAKGDRGQDMTEQVPGFDNL
jgi:hypothetical protein